MGIIHATTGAELMSGESVNVISDYEGTAMLAPLFNMNPDPLFKNFDNSTGLKYWTMGHAPKPNGWMPFVRDNNIEENFSRQTTAPLAMNQDVLDIPNELVPGATPRDKRDTIDIAAPLIPKVETYQVSTTVGFPAGWYCMAHDWVLPGPRSTGPGERSEPFFLAQGQGIELSVPTDVPDGVEYMQPWLTPPCATANEALGADLYGQHTYKIKTMLRRTPMYGPLVLTNKWDGQNHSYVGTNDYMQPIRVANYSARVGYGGWTEGIGLSYRWVTEQGEGMSSPVKNVVLGWASDENALLLWAVPPQAYTGMTGWILEIHSSDPEDGALTKYDVFKFGGVPFKINEWAPVYGGQPEYIVAGAPIEMVSNTATIMIDNTGMEPPENIMDEPVILDLESSGLTPGRHYVKTALFVDEEEGPASNYALKDVAMGEGLRIHKPRWHERLDNADLTDRDNQDIPRGWDILDSDPNITVYSERKNVIRIDDDSTTTVDANYFTSPPAGLDPQFGRYTLDMRFRWMNYIRGVVSVQMKEYDKDGTVLATQELEVLGKNANHPKTLEGVRETINRKYRLTKREEDVTAPFTFKLNTATTEVKLQVMGRIRTRKSTTDTRVLDAEISDFSMTAGWSTPRIINIDLDELQNRTIPAPPPTSVADTLYQNFSRPHGGYCVAVEDPVDAPKLASYTTKDYTIFETGTSEDWQQNQASAVHYINRVEREAALYGQYGLTLAKTADGVGQNNVTKTFAPSSALTIVWDMYIDLFSTHDVELGSIRADDGTALARLVLKANGDVEVRGGTTVQTQTLDLGLDDGNLVHFELSCDISSGRVTLTFGIDEDNQEEVAVITGVSFGAFTDAARAVLGPSTDGVVNNVGRFDFKYGKIMITDLRVLDNVTTSTGNYIEYYGPDGTPKNNRYGPTGLRIPAKAWNSYTIGVNIWHEDMTANSSLWKIRAKDKDHNTLRTYSPVVSGMTGDNRRWLRHQKTIETPANTSYLEFYENDLGAGILKIHALQIEEGVTMNDFDWQRETNGYFTTYLRTRQAGIEKDDPAVELSHIKRLRDILVASVDTNQLTTTTTYRTGDTFSELAATPYISDYTQLNTEKEIIEVRVDMASTVLGETPEVRGIQVDLERPYSQLLRPDGTEYTGGTLAFDISTPTEPPNMEIINKASGGKEAQTWGTVRTKNIKFRVAAFRRSTVAQIVEQEEHILETPKARYTVITNEAPEFLAEPATRVYFPDGREFFQREIAEFEGFITYEEPLVNYAQ